MIDRTGPVIVTGANGFLGRHICLSLLKEGFEVVAIVNRSQNMLDNLASQYSRLKIHIFDLVLANETLTNLPRPPIALVHAAGLDATSTSDFRPNITMARVVSLITRLLNIPRVVNISSQNVTFVKRGNYASSKLIAEKIFEEVLHDRVVHTLRPTLIYDDSGNKFIEQLVSLGRRVRMVPLLGFKDPKLQPVHASDVASVVTQLVSHGVAETHIIAGATPIGLHEIAKAISRHVIAIPIPIPYFFLKYFGLVLRGFSEKVFELYENKTLGSNEVNLLQSRFGRDFRSFKEDLPKILKQM